MSRGRVFSISVAGLSERGGASTSQKRADKQGLLLGSRSGSCWGSRSGCSFCGNFWFGDDGHNDVAVEVGTNTCREREIADVDRCVEPESGHINHDGSRQILRKAMHFDRVVVNLKEATQLNTLRFADEIDEDLRVNFFVHVHCVEVNVQDPTAEVVVLNFLNQRQLVAFAVFDLEVH